MRSDLESLRKYKKLKRLPLGGRFCLAILNWISCDPELKNEKAPAFGCRCFQLKLNTILKFPQYIILSNRIYCYLCMVSSRPGPLERIFTGSPTVFSMKQVYAFNCSGSRLNLRISCNDCFHPANDSYKGLTGLLKVS